MGNFERYLTLWVLLCIVLGIALGAFFPSVFQLIAQWEYASVNFVVAILIWLMIFPMMVKIDFSSLKDLNKNWKGLSLTVGANWLIKPFSMALFAWIFLDLVFGEYLGETQSQEYIAGAILLGAAPCTAMVFVWSYLTKGDANFTLVQVAINDLILLIAFIPIVQFLLGVTSVAIPFDVLLTSVVVFVVIPLLAGFLVNRWAMQTKGLNWLNEVLLARLRPLNISALLLTLVLLFAFQGQQILDQPLVILIIAIPLIIQTYFIFFGTWFVGKWMGITHPVCAPAALIGASNFFELAVAVAIALFGLDSGAALATVVGVLIEVPVMLSLVALANKWRY